MGLFIGVIWLYGLQVLLWCIHERLICYYFSKSSIRLILWGPRVNPNWSQSRDFKGLVICITGLNCFNLGFYLASYGQFCFRGKTRISAILCFIVSLSLLYFVLLFLVLLFMGTVHTSLEHHIFLPYNSKSSSSSFLSNPKSTTTTQTNSPVCLTSCWT